MSTEFALDLRLARRKAGFTQRDVAHLLAVLQSHVSDYERGRIRPGLREIVTLSVIYHRSFESLFSELMAEAKRDLRERVATVPQNVRTYAGTFNRESSLRRLQYRLEAEHADRGGA